MWGWKNNLLGSSSWFGVGRLHVLETLSVYTNLGCPLSTSFLEIVHARTLGPCERPRGIVGLYAHTFFPPSKKKKKKQGICIAHTKYLNRIGHEMKWN